MSTHTKAPRQDAPLGVVLYLRTAARDPDEYGAMDRQRETVQRWALEHGCSILHTFEDEGISAYSAASNRPGFCAMLEYCQKHPVAQVLIARWDRLARSRAGCEALIRQLQDTGVTVRSISGEAGPCEWQSSTVAA